jgi:hypothetical protein
VREVPEKDALSPKWKAALQLIQGLLPAITGILAGLWVAKTYLDQQKTNQTQQQIQAEKDSRTRLLEARKPFIDKQLALYIETTKVAGELASTYSSGPTNEWNNSFRRFEQLYWTELSMVEDDNVRLAMEDFYKYLNWVNEQPAIVPLEKWRDLQYSSYRLARAIRGSIESTWDVTLSNTPSPNSAVKPTTLPPAEIGKK